MFSSIHSKRLYKWFFSKKIFKVQLKIEVNDRFLYTEIEVNAYTKNQAIQLAEKDLRSQITINKTGIRSFGKVKNFDEFS